MQTRLERALETLGLEGLLVAVGSGFLAAIVFIPYQVHRWGIADVGFASSLQLRTVQTALLLAVTFALTYAAVGLAVRRLRAEVIALQESLVSIAEGELRMPIQHRGLLGDVGMTIELMRQRVLERNRRSEERTAELVRRVAHLEAPAYQGPADARMAVELRVGGRTGGASLMELSQREAVVRIDAAAGIDLARGMTALLVIRAPGDGARVDLPALVTRRVEGEAGITYEFALDGTGRLAGLAPSLAAVFDNRRDFRVTPDPRAPATAEVVVEGALSPFAARVIDLSASGVGLLVRADSATLSTWGTRLLVRLLLPGQGGTLPVRARIRNIAAVAGGSRVGLSFEANEPAELEAVQKEISVYVMSRHREQRLGGVQLAG